MEYIIYLNIFRLESENLITEICPLDLLHDSKCRTHFTELNCHDSDVTQIIYLVINNKNNK